jgi:hypothetical protein
MKPFKFKAQLIFLPVFVLIFGLFLVPGISHASTNITATSSWGDVLGWVNFGPTNGNVTVTNTTITGYAWSANYGWINLAPTKGGVVNDGNGNLSGKAWGQNTGWIDFTGVSINSSGKFIGQTASSSIAGVINFSCTNCLVTTTWRPASQTTPSSTSSSGSYVGGGYSQVPLITSTTSTSTNVNGNNFKYQNLPLRQGFGGQANNKSMSNGQISNANISSSLLSTSTSTNYSSHPYKYLSSTTSNVLTLSSIGRSWSSLWHNVLFNIPKSAKVIGGASVVLLIILILWRFITL